MPDEHADEPEDLDKPPAFFPYGDGEAPDLGDPSSKRLVEVEVEAVYAAQTEEQIQRFVLLTDGDRRLPIVIGHFEAIAISMALDKIQAERPMTHDLFQNMIEKLGARVDRVVIDDIWGTTYYAKIYLLVLKTKEEMEIDGRPSDALALAVRFGAKIFVVESILQS